MQVDSSLYSLLDLSLARLLVKKPDIPLFNLIAAVSKMLSQGHSYLPLSRLEQDADLRRETGLPAYSPEQCLQLIRDEGLPVWLEGLDEQQPALVDSLLVLDKQSNLYFSRYFCLERDIAHSLHSRQQALPDLTELQKNTIKHELEKLFPPSDDDQPIDLQALAAVMALNSRLSIISGGPGTGKTTTLVKLLALLLQLGPLNIRLAAPTGKAAARMAESIKQGKNKLMLNEVVADAIPEQAQTLHHLIEQLKYPGEEIQLLIIDEASMLDLLLFHKVLMAVPIDCRIILLGDKDQLPAVEVGNIFADLCRAQWLDSFSSERWQIFTELMPALESCQALQATAGSQLDLLPSSLPNPFSLAVAEGVDWANACVQLMRSYRFDEASGIGQLANAIKQGNAAKSLEILNSDTVVDLKYVAGQNRLDTLIRQAVSAYSDYLKLESLQKRFESLQKVQVLAAVYDGVSGVHALNHAIAQGLHHAGLLSVRGEIYPGLPIMLQVNHPSLGLFNGDLGLFDYDQSGQLKCFFGRGEGDFIAVPPALLPRWQAAFAISVHKSQGSEFDEVFLVLPEMPSALLSRELFYTGVTRAKNRLHLFAQDQDVIQACEKKTERFSGLAQQLLDAVL